jgi:hypothetical protein
VVAGRALTPEIKIMRRRKRKRKRNTKGEER